MIMQIVSYMLSSTGVLFTLTIQSKLKEKVCKEDNISESKFPLTMYIIITQQNTKGKVYKVNKKIYFTI